MTFVENEFYYSNDLVQREETHWDPTISHLFPPLCQNPNLDAAHHPQSVPIESANIDSSSLPAHQQVEPMVIDSGGEVCLEKAIEEKGIKVYSRRPKNPDP